MATNDGSSRGFYPCFSQNPILKFATMHPSRGFSPFMNIWAHDSFIRGRENLLSFVSETGLTRNSWNQQHGGGRSYSFFNNMLNGGQSSCYTPKNNYKYGCFSRLNVRAEEATFLLSMARTKEGSLQLQKMIKFGTPNEKQKILDGVLTFLFEVMTDQYGHKLFLTLLEFCDSDQFRTIFVALTSNRELFLYASHLKYSSIVVQRFIKNLKNSGLAHCITSILSMRFVELMTSEHGRFVMHQCFYTFKANENEVLFNCTVRYFIELATTLYGCTSLIVCLGCILGVQRLQLLQNIAETSDFLANDPYGLHVVQEVLMLKNSEITHIICDRLKMHYTHLAFEKGGSYVVQKCILTSEYGFTSVLDSLLLENEKTFCILAGHQFGNYVVQTALKTLRTHNIQLYQSMVAFLKAKSLDISCSRIGKRIWNMVKSLESSTVEEHTQF